MKNAIKRFACLALAVLMLFSVAACGEKETSSQTSDETLGYEIVDDVKNNDKDDDTTDDTEVVQSGSSGGGELLIEQSSKGAKVVNNCYVSGYPVAKEKITLNIMMTDDLNGADPHKRALTKFINQKFNVELKFQTIQNAQVSEKVTLAFASGQTPDLFWGMGLLGDVSAIDGYAKAGKLYSYDDYKEYAPNIYKMFKENRDAQYLCTSIDGKIYTVPLYREDTDLFTDLFYINKTWLKKVNNGKMPKTVDDLTAVLRKFKNNDPNGNGKADEIPMVLVGEVPTSWYGFFGMGTYNYETRTKDNKIKIAYTTEEYKKAISLLSDYYAEGLLQNTEIRSVSTTKAKSLMNASVKTIGVIGGNIKDYDGIMSDETYLNHYTMMPILDGTGKGQQTASYMDKEQCWACWGFIPKTCKYPEIVIRLMDYFYTVEGSAVGNYGPPGKNTYWNYNSKGEPILNNNGTSPRDFWIGHPCPRYISTAIEDQNFFVNEPKYDNQNKAKAMALYNAEFKNIYGKIKPVMTYNAPMTEKESERLNKEVSSNLTNTRVEWMYRFIVGSKNINSEWNTYINEVSRLGAKAQEEVKQAADTRMQNWLKKNK